ncbi:MAG: TSUP family transporter [Candidatus Lokiarchaeota archaeon]|nr:TSUP family transporter [Candidatus Lokiarchaeota archaeon]MBD3339760.1 TSUP family transporter [Candidatus Lokiarchaeota archaeon]
MEDIFSIIIILIILGFLVGTIASIVGIGGGVLFVPILLLIYRMPITMAIDTSTFIILISSGVGFFTYLKDRRIDLKATVIFASFSILGGLSCMFFLLFVKIEDFILRMLFATLLLIAGLNVIYKSKIWLKKKQPEAAEKEFSLLDHDYRTNLAKAIPLFFMAGFTAYLLGIGGGVINTPVLHIVLGYPIHNSTAMSTGIIFFTAIVNTILKAFVGQINYIVGLFIAIGAVFGAFFGAKISGKMPKKQLQIVVAIVLIIVAIRMYF